MIHIHHLYCLKTNLFLILHLLTFVLLYIFTLLHTSSSLPHVNLPSVSISHHAAQPCQSLWLQNRTFWICWLLAVLQRECVFPYITITPVSHFWSVSSCIGVECVTLLHHIPDLILMIMGAVVRSWKNGALCVCWSAVSAAAA